MKKFRAEFYSSESGESVYSCFCLETVNWDLAWAITRLMMSKYDTVVNLKVVEDESAELEGLRRIKKSVKDAQIRSEGRVDQVDRVINALANMILDSEFNSELDEEEDR